MTLAPQSIGSIILVEDDLANAEALSILLKQEHQHTVSSFRSGQELIVHLDKIVSNNPVLFLLDYQLPQTNALALYEQLRTVEELKHVPTIILSARQVGDEEKERISQLGFLFVSKPYDVDELLTLVAQQLGQ